MTEYGDPLVSGFNSRIARQVAAAMFVQAKWLTFWSYVFGRNPSRKFRMADIYEGQDELVRLMRELEAEEGEAVCELATKITTTCISLVMPDSLTISQTKGKDSRDVRANLAKALAIVAPLIDSYDSVDRSEDRFSLQLIDALAALEAGELPAVFEPAPRKAKNVNSYTVSVIKYEFFLMNRILRQAGFSRAEINAMYRECALAHWDSVSRWKSDVAKILNLKTMKELEDKMARVSPDGATLSRPEAERTMRALKERFRAARAPTRKRVS